MNINNVQVPAKVDLYTNHNTYRGGNTQNRISYEQIYWSLFTGFVFVISGVCVLLSQVTN